VQHARLVKNEIDYVTKKYNTDSYDKVIGKIMEGYHKIKNASEFDISPNYTPFGEMDSLEEEISTILEAVVEGGRLPVVTFSAGGIATPADAALLMHHGMDGVFVGSGIFKSADPKVTAEAIVMATHHYGDSKIVSEASAMMGDAMPGLEIENLETRYQDR